MQEPVCTWIADFMMKDRLAYLSHQETLTLFERALTRARAPLSFSGGFNPRPHLSLPLPRSVGVQSNAERLCVTLGGPNIPSPESLREGVNAELPQGCTVTGSLLLAGKVVVQPQGFRLQFTLCQPVSTALTDHLANALEEFRAGRPVMIRRFVAKKDTFKPLDIAPFIERAELADSIIDVQCRILPQGSVRVDELMQWLSLQPEHLREPVRRMEIYWQPNAA